MSRFHLNRRELLRGTAAAAVAAVVPSVTAAVVPAAVPVIPPEEPLALLPGLLEPPPESCVLDFNQLSLVEKRLAVFRDVVASLTHSQVSLGRGMYLGRDVASSDLPTTLSDCDAPLADAVPLMRKHCQACLLGSLFLSYAEMNRNIKFWDFGQRYLNRVAFDVYHKLPPALVAIFSCEQPVLMESAFEGRNYCYQDADVDDGKKALANTYYRRFRDSQTCILTVCRNAIRNGGEFIPVEKEPCEENA